MKNLISVIIPVFNRAETIGTAINSVLQQSNPNFELIIIDDCSTDNITEVITGINDPRIKFFQLKENKGTAAARNLGIKNSTGRIISFLDSDDNYEKNFLKISYNTLIETPSHVGFMWTGVRYHIGSEIKELSWAPVQKGNTYLTFLHNLQIGTGAGISIKKEVFDNCGIFNEQLPAAEDTEFFLRISQRFDYIFSTDILININKHSSDRMSKNYENVAEAYNIFIDSHWEEIEKDEELQKKFYYKLMWLNYRLKNKRLARQYFHKLPKKDPKTFFKSGLIFLAYELLDVDTAGRIHGKVSKS